MTLLDRNLDALQNATGEVRTEFARMDSADTVKRFFHLVLMECAERMTNRDFRRAIDIAREQLRRPS